MSRNNSKHGTCLLTKHSFPQQPQSLEEYCGQAFSWYDTRKQPLFHKCCTAEVFDHPLYDKLCLAFGTTTSCEYELETELAMLRTRILSDYSYDVVSVEKNFDKNHPLSGEILKVRKITR
jgi:hypothetical protein